MTLRRPHVAPAVCVVVLLVFLVTSYALSRANSPRTEASAEGLEKVVVFAVPGLGLDDLDAGVVPNMDALARRGSIAIVNVRTQPAKPDLVAAFSSLGAGNRTYGADGLPDAMPARLPWLGSDAATVISSRVGHEVSGDLAVPGLPDVAEQVKPEGGTTVGALGTALRRAGRTTAFVGQSGVAEGSGPGRLAPGALAVVDDDGMIDEGSVDDGLLASLVDADGHGRVISDPERFAAAVARAQRAADVVFVDTGDTTRAAAQAAVEAEEVEADGSGDADGTVDRTSTSQAPAPEVTDPDPVTRAEELRVSALRRTDETLGRIAARLAPRTLLLVVGVTPPGSAWGFTPLISVGRGIERGYIDSTSTHRPALVTLTDLAPTILDVVGAPVPEGMIGHPLRFRPGDANWHEAQILDDLIANRASVDRTMNVIFIGVQSLLYGMTAVLMLAGHGLMGRRRRIFFVAALTCGAWPAATFILRIWTPLYSMGPWTIVLSWAIAATIAGAATRLRSHRLDPVIFVSALTVLILVADLATGAHLQVGSFFGYMPHTAPRFTGIGNSGFALLAGASIIVVTGTVARIRDRDVGWWIAATVAAIVVTADGAPWMGTDVGGILALVPVLGVTLWALRGRPVRARTVLIAALLGATVLALAVGFEALRSPADRTHIGRFFLDAGEGSGASSTLRRKWNTNVADLARNPILWSVPALAAVGVVLGRRSVAIRRNLPSGSPQRIAAAATLSVGVAGWLVNDSGVVVLALACVQLGPLLLAVTGSEEERSTTPASHPVGGLDPPSRPPSGDPSGDGGASATEATGSPTGNIPTATQTEPTRTVEIVNEPEPDPEPAINSTPIDARVRRVVAIVPAKDREDRIADTVAALRALTDVDTVLVVDDGSTDDTAGAAAAAGAEVLRLPTNRGKGAAVLAGAAHTPDAEVYLLIDADLSRTAGAADLLLGPVLSGEADLTVGVLPSAGGKGGFGAIRRASAAGIRRACGLQVRAPLSGQRAIRANLLRNLVDAERFGLEVAMTIDVVRAGGRVLEVEVPMDHLHTGKSLKGFAHRGGQGIDIARSLWPRLTTARQRIALTMISTLLVTGLAVVVGASSGTAGDSGGKPASKVLLFALNPYSFDDLRSQDTPNLNALMERGSVGAMSVRTVSRSASDREGFLAIGSGARLFARSDSTRVLPSNTSIGPMTAGEYLKGVTGKAPSGNLAVLGAVSLLRDNEGPSAAGSPGFLGDTLAQHGLRSSFVGTGDRPGLFGADDVVNRPAALAVMRSDGGVSGVVDGLTISDPSAPYGVRSDPGKVASAVLGELERSAMVVVDTGDLDRADDWARVSLPVTAAREWAAAAERTDETLGRILDGVDDDTLVIVTSLRPRSGYHLQPAIVVGPNVPAGTLQSGSTKRDGLVAVTDLAPTILNALGIPKPVEVPGNPIRYEPGTADIDHLERIDRDTEVRERTYYGQSWYFIVAHAVVYAIALLVVARRQRWPRLAPWASWLALSLASYPMTSFLVRLVPGISAVFQAQVLLAVAGALAMGALASRRRGDPLRGVSLVTGSTTAVIVFDTWIGTPMQMSSWLGSSMHNAGRFYGIPNTTFAVLGACSIIWAGLHVDGARRRTEAIVTVACVFVVALLSAGLPMLGADVGTLMTLFPAYALMLVALSGRRVRFRTAAAAMSTMTVLVVLAALADLARPAASRTHLGRFAEKVRDEGFDAISESFLRKQSANFRILGSSTWTDMLPIVAVFLVVTLVVWRWWPDAFRTGSARRTAFLAVIGTALLGFAANDSGPIVIALFVAFLAPYTLQAVRSARAATLPVAPGGSVSATNPSEPHEPGPGSDVDVDSRQPGRSTLLATPGGQP